MQEVVLFANDRCNQENVIGQLTSGVNALRMPSDGLMSNWAYMVIAAPRIAPGVRPGLGAGKGRAFLYVDEDRVGSKKACDVLMAMQAKPRSSISLILRRRAWIEAHSITATASETVPPFNLQVAARLLLLQSLTSTKSGPPG
jgi:hypothetical protein